MSNPYHPDDVPQTPFWSKVENTMRWHKQIDENVDRKYEPILVPPKTKTQAIMKVLIILICTLGLLYLNIRYLGYWSIISFPISFLIIGGLWVNFLLFIHRLKSVRKRVYHK